jgi:hypothetical protein
MTLICGLSFLERSLSNFVILSEVRRQPNVVEGPHASSQCHRPMEIFHHKLSSCNRLPWKCHLPTPLLSEVFPPWIVRLNQSDLLRAPPPLQLLFPSNRIEHVFKCFVIHQPVTMVLASKACKQSALMLPSPPLNIVSHADVQSPAEACNDVSPIFMVHARKAL